MVIKYSLHGLKNSLIILSRPAPLLFLSFLIAFDISFLERGKFNSSNITSNSPQIYMSFDATISSSGT